MYSKGIQRGFKGNSKGIQREFEGHSKAIHGNSSGFKRIQVDLKIFKGIKDVQGNFQIHDDG